MVQCCRRGLQSLPPSARGPRFHLPVLRHCNSVVYRLERKRGVPSPHTLTHSQTHTHTQIHTHTHTHTGQKSPTCMDDSTMVSDAIASMSSTVSLHINRACACANLTCKTGGHCTLCIELQMVALQTMITSHQSLPSPQRQPQQLTMLSRRRIVVRACDLASADRWI